LNILSINGVDIGHLVNVTWGEIAVKSEDSDMDMAGNTNVDIIIVKTLINCTCGLLKWADASIVLGSLDLKAKGGAVVDVTFPDAKKGIFITKEFTLTSMASPSIVNNGGICWDGISFSLEELGGER
jgi:hypothetical protein